LAIRLLERLCSLVLKEGNACRIPETQPPLQTPLTLIIVITRNGFSLRLRIGSHSKGPVFGVEGRVGENRFCWKGGTGGC